MFIASAPTQEKRLIMPIEHGREMAKEGLKSFIVSGSQLM